MSVHQSSRRVILVTGANRGIGYGIVRGLAQQYPSSFFEQTYQKPLTIYVGSRSEERGREAIKSLQEELGGALGGGEQAKVKLALCQLDMNDAASRKGVIDLLQQKEGGLDTVIQNAGIALDGFDGNVVRKTFETNLYNLIAFNDELLPILRPEARIVILASMAGALNGYSDEITKRFRSASKVDDVKQLAQDFQKAVDDGTYEQQGWKGAAYSTSKACVIAYTRAFAKQLQQQQSNVSVNCCCPGYVNTDMTKGRGVKTLDQGAKTPIMLALNDLNGGTGKYYQDQKEKDW